MKIKIDGDFTWKAFGGEISIKWADVAEFGAFVRSCVPALTKTLFEKFAHSLCSKTDKDEAIRVLSLTALVMNANISENLTEVVNDMMWEDRDDEDDDEDEDECDCCESKKNLSKKGK